MQGVLTEHSIIRHHVRGWRPKVRESARVHGLDLPPLGLAFGSPCANVPPEGKAREWAWSWTSCRVHHVELHAPPTDTSRGSLKNEDESLLFSRHHSAKYVNTLRGRGRSAEVRRRAGIRLPEQQRRLTAGSVATGRRPPPPAWPRCCIARIHLPPSSPPPQSLLPPSHRGAHETNQIKINKNKMK